jgi:hypothetical protein
MAGVEVRGWMGMGVVFGASWTGVALGAGVSAGTGVCCAGGTGVFSQAVMRAARNSRRTFFMRIASRMKASHFDGGVQTVFARVLQTVDIRIDRQDDSGEDAGSHVTRKSRFLPRPGPVHNV